MADRLDQVVGQAIAVTLENMAFMESAPVQADTEVPTTDNGMMARMLVLEPFQGEVQLAATTALLRNVIEVVHAFPDDEVVEEMLSDMLGELLNTIGGRLLTEYLPESQSYRLGLPEVGWELPDCSEGQSRAWNLQIEDQGLVLTLVGDGFFAGSI